MGRGAYPNTSDDAALRHGSHHGIYEARSGFIRRAFRSSIFLDAGGPVRGRIAAQGVFMTDSSGGGSVLVVDDEEALVRGVQRVLARAGFSVDAVSNGQEAVALLEQKVFDCIVSDINMPGMSGIDLLRAVRERDLDVPVVLLTGAPTVTTAAHAVECAVSTASRRNVRSSIP